MEVLRDRTFTGPDHLRVDGTHFINCTFEQVQFRYGGGTHPLFDECTFDRTSWYFDDAALRSALAGFARASVPGLHVLALNEIPDNRRVRLVSTVGR